MKNRKEKLHILSGTENTLSKMPKYNPYQTGHGVIGDTKYNRNKQKRTNEQEKNDWENER